MEDTQTQYAEPKMKLSIKLSARGQKHYDYTVRADTPEELKALKDSLQQIADEECAEAGTVKAENE